MLNRLRCLLKQFICYFIFICCVFLLGCSQAPSSSSFSSQEAGADAPSPAAAADKNEPFAVSEPIISNEGSKEYPFNLLNASLEGKEERSIPLGGIMENLEGAVFYIDDSIVFSAAQETVELSSVRFFVESECVETQSQKIFRRNIEMDYKSEVNLIELLPVEILSYGNLWWQSHLQQNSPICSFQFKAQNQSEDIHYFKLPYLTIAEFEQSVNLSLIEQSMRNPFQEPIEQFPILEFDQIREKNYAVIAGHNSSIDRLQLVCERFQISFPAADTKEYDLWKLQGWTAVQEEQKANQPCRFVSWLEDSIVGVSQLFPIVFPVKNQLRVEILSHQRDGTSLKGMNDIGNLMRNFKKNREFGGLYHQVASLAFTNNSAEPVYLWIPQLSFLADTTFFYDGVNYSEFNYMGNIELGRLGYFVPQEEGASFHLKRPVRGAVQNHSRQQVLEEDERESVRWSSSQALLAVNAGSTLLVPLSVNIDYDCRRADDVENIGISFEAANPQIYQVLDIKDFETARQTALGLIDWSQKQERDDFHLQFDLFVEDFGRRYFYQNTCRASKGGYISPSVDRHNLAWRVVSRQSYNSNKGGVKFRRSRNHTLAKAFDSAVQKRKKEDLEKVRRGAPRTGPRRTYSGEIIMLR